MVGTCLARACQCEHGELQLRNKACRLHRSCVELPKVVVLQHSSASSSEDRSDRCDGRTLPQPPSRHCNIKLRDTSAAHTDVLVSWLLPRGFHDLFWLRYQHDPRSRQGARNPAANFDRKSRNTSGHCSEHTFRARRARPLSASHCRTTNNFIADTAQQVLTEDLRRKELATSSRHHS